MKLTRISIQNLNRRKGRVVLILLGLVVGVGAVVGLFSALTVMTKDIDKKLSEYGISIIVTPKLEELSLSYGGVTVASTSSVKEFNQSVITKLKRIEGKKALKLIAPKTFGVANVEGEKVLLAGVDFPVELKLKKWWKLIGKKPATSRDLILGNEAAAVLKKTSGDEISINKRNFRVVAVLREMGSPEDNLVFADLREVQSLLGHPGKLNLIEIGAEFTDYSLEELVTQIAKEVPEAEVASFTPAIGSRDKTVQVFAKFALTISVIVLFIGGLIVMVTMMSSVNERVTEIGIFRAMGFRKRHIMTIILYEAFLISLVSGILGWFFGITLARLIVPVFGSTKVAVSWDFRLLLLSLVLAIGVGLAGSFYPARRAAHFDPATAIRVI
jgi:putative ABC transport system permease protein